MGLYDGSGLGVELDHGGRLEYGGGGPNKKDKISEK